LLGRRGWRLAVETKLTSLKEREHNQRAPEDVCDWKHVKKCNKEKQHQPIISITVRRE
jgi:hypothetical protein